METKGIELKRLLKWLIIAAPLYWWVYWINQIVHLETINPVRPLTLAFRQHILPKPKIQLVEQL